jgi:mRNA interferase RelE/StbE
LADAYNVELSKPAAKKLKKFDRQTQKSILAALSLLREHPRPANATALVGHPGWLRVRVGNYRIVYTINDDKLIVLVLAIGHRRSVYDFLS